jgi:hypothetical protein
VGVDEQVMEELLEFVGVSQHDGRLRAQAHAEGDAFFIEGQS